MLWIAEADTEILNRQLSNAQISVKENIVHPTSRSTGKSKSITMADKDADEPSAKKVPRIKFTQKSASSAGPKSLSKYDDVEKVLDNANSPLYRQGTPLKVVSSPSAMVNGIDYGVEHSQPSSCQGCARKVTRRKSASRCRHR